MPIITARRDDPDQPLQIEALGNGSAVDVEESCQRIGEVEKMVGGLALEITITRDSWPRCEQVSGTLATTLRAVYEGSDGDRNLLPSARLRVHLYAIGQPLVEPEDRYPASLENRLAFACQSWWRRNRNALRCINAGSFLVDYSEVRQAHDRRVMRALLSEKLAVACGRCLAAMEGVGCPELDHVRELLSEYDAL